jgi:RecA-family ATPase
MPRLGGSPGPNLVGAFSGPTLRRTSIRQRSTGAGVPSISPANEAEPYRAVLSAMSEQVRRPHHNHTAELFDLAALKQTDARTIISRYVPLTYKTKYAVGLCPFHQEKHPSFVVWPIGFKCFSCGESGDSISFVQKIERISFVDACVKLGVEKLDPDEAGRRNHLAAINQLAIAWQKRRLIDPIKVADDDHERQLLAAEPNEVRYLHAIHEQNEALNVRSLASGHLKDLPAEQWLVPDVLPLGAVCLFSGAEGSGKSYLLLDLMIAAATGQAWVGQQLANPVRSFAWFCEDPEHTVLWRRDKLLSSRGLRPGDLENQIDYSSRYGLDSWLLDFDQRNERCKPTQLWRWLIAHGYLEGRQLVIFDTRDDMMNGDPYRPRVARATMLFLTEWARDNNACVLLTTHPPKPSGGSNTPATQYGGSQQWRAKARTHLHLERPMVWSKDEKRMIPEGPKGNRLLTVSKSNWGKDGTAIPIRWDYDQHCFVFDEWRAPH